MYAIVNIQGHQFRVEPEATMQVPLMDAEPGSTVTFDQMLMLSDGDSFSVGRPHVAGGMVTAEVVRHGLGDKVRVFKKKRRKNYRRNKGHRQPFTEIVIKSISA